MIFEPNWINLLLGSIMILFPLMIFLKTQLGLLKELSLSFVRMIVQLLLAGFYLKYIIDLNNISINILFLLVMISAGAWTVSSRSELNAKEMTTPIFIAFFSGFITVSLFVYLFYFEGGDYLNARFMIPISGMLIGNSLSSAVVGIRSFFKSLRTFKKQNEYLLVSGSSMNALTEPLIRDALKDGFKPMLANISAIGLIWIPGTMTGQIITGASPLTAIKYQIMIVFGYFCCCVITSYLSILLARRYAYNEYGVLRKEIYK